MEKMSAQLKWQRERLEKNLCPQCGKPRGKHYHCDACHEKVVARVLKWSRKKRKEEREKDNGNHGTENG